MKETEAQQICLEVIKEVKNLLEIIVQDYENDGIFDGEPLVILEPYNRGYLLKVEASYDWRKCEEMDAPSFIPQVYIQPGTFFESYLYEGEKARIECSFYKANALGYQTEDTKISNLTEFKAVAIEWKEKCLHQLKNM